jgi:lipoprotein-anchoring transpeptidase ErfK/SrfK
MKLKLIIPIIFVSVSSSCITNNEETKEPIKNHVVENNTEYKPPIIQPKPVPTEPKSESQPVTTTVTRAPIIPEPKTEPCEKRTFDNQIIVDISEQKLYLHCNYRNGKKEVKIYPVSTSKYGIGSEAGSNKTPLGLHTIENKIGYDAAPNTIFKARRNTGRKAIINKPGSGDLVTSRIMWLKGLEPGKNSGRGIDSYRRYIYIHGTGEENKIGEIASHGCIRMYNTDVIDLFDRVDEGTTVEIKR